MTAMTAAVTPAVRVLEYSLIAYRRSYRASLFSSFVQPALFLAAMGLGLGGIVDRSGATASLGGVSYLAFLAPGLLVAAGMQVAFTESTFPVVAGINWVRTYYAMIATPVTTGAVAAGQIGFILVRLALGATIFSVVMILFGVVVSPSAFVIGIFASVLTGLAFATPICAFSATQRNGTSFNALFRFGMTPLFLFSGTFFPVDRLPPLLQAVVRRAAAAATGAERAAVAAGLHPDHQGRAVVPLLQAGLAVDERLELLHPIEDRLDAHPGALAGSMKRGNSIVSGGCLRMRSLLSRRVQKPLTHPQILRKSPFFQGFEVSPSREPPSPKSDQARATP